MILAGRGVVWAQAEVGNCMIDGIRGFEKKRKSGLEWLNKAAAQNYPPALYLLSELYRNGSINLLRKSQEKANELMIKAANLGYASANFKLARFHMSGTDGFEEDLHQSYFRASVVFTLDDKDKQAALMMSHFHHEQKQSIIEPSPYLMCYYLNIAANVDDNGKACYIYSSAIARLYNVRVNGFNPMPAAFFWARKSRDMGFNDAKEMLKMWESHGQSQCANCGKGAQGDGKFKQCSKCKAQWYCSKECQVEAWRAGHKNDCKRARMLKFEDYLNAE